MTPAAENRSNFFVLILSLVWAGVVLFQYFFYPTHPVAQVLPFLGSIFDVGNFSPLNSDQFWQIQVTSFQILLLTLLISMITWALGRRIRVWLSLNLLDAWVRFAFDFGMGIGALNLFWIGTGLERIWFKPLWVGAGLGLVLLALWDLWVVWKAISSEVLKRLYPKEGSYFFLFLIGLFYLGFSILEDLAPETFYDSMVYHLAVPQYWLFNHGLRDFPTNFFSNYPYGAETFFLNGLVFQGTETAKMLHVASFGVCALLAGGWAREIAGEKAGWLALGLTLTLPLFAINTWTSQVEGFLSLAVILFLYALYRFAREENKQVQWGLVTGLFLGLAFSVKYTAVLPAGIGLFALVFQKVSVFKKEKWDAWLAMGLGAALVLGPWLIKNWSYTGNPFFPYLMSHFSGRHLPVWGYEKLLEEQTARVTPNWWSWLLLPWTLTMANPDSYNFCGPLALALVPLFLLFRLRHAALRFLVFVTPLFLIAGFGVTHILRFVLPDFALFYILVAAVLAGGNKPLWGRMTAWLAGISAILCFAYLAGISHFYYGAAGIWSGRQTREAYLVGPGKITPYYGMARWVSDNLPPTENLLVVGDSRGLYYDRFFLTNTVFDDQVLGKISKEERNAEGIRRRLKELGVEALVVNGSEGIRVSADYHHYNLTTEEWKRLDDFVQKGTDLVYFQNFQGVYRVLQSLKEPPKTEITDMMLFFSKPASSFLKDIRLGKTQEAKEALDQALLLYPFSQTWKLQKKEFDARFGLNAHG